MQIRRLTDLWGSRGRSPSPSPCRGPAKRGPKGYAGLSTLECSKPALRRPPQRSRAPPRTAGTGPSSASSSASRSRASRATRATDDPSLLSRSAALCAAPPLSALPVYTLRDRRSSILGDPPARRITRNAPEPPKRPLSPSRRRRHVKVRSRCPLSGPRDTPPSHP